MNKNTHKTVGMVYNVSLNSENNFADILVSRQDEFDSPLVMGQFITLHTKDSKGKYFIGTVEMETPDYSADTKVKESARALIKQNKSRGFDEMEFDDFYKEDALFISYRCRMLGICVDNGEEIKYYSNIRTFPSTVSLCASIPDASFMNRLFMSAVNKGDNDEKDVIFEIGRLQYGTLPDYTQSYKIGSSEEVKVQFNATNLLRKRTAIFGKSGYGKSNTVKTVIGMMSTEQPHCGQLILDTNGEYALDNNQNDGLMDIFHEAGMKDKVVLYTSRTVSPKHISKFGQNAIKPLKFDVYEQIKPAFEVVASNIESSGRSEPLYLNPWSSALDGEDDAYNYFKNTNSAPLVWAIWYAGLFRAGLVPYNDQHTKAPLTVSKAYLQYLVAEATDGSVDLKSLAKDEDSQEYDQALDAVITTYGFYRDGKKIVTRKIEEMAKYAEWYVENEMKEDSSLKGFSEILEYPRRFYALKAFNLENDGKQKYKSLSLGESVYRDLKDNKIVILDLASVSIKVAKTLAQQVLGHLLTSASKMFGDYASREEFSRFDALVYIEEAQNYLSPEEARSGSVYERLAKEGRKFHIGLAYITQQPSAIDQKITSQTENIIAMHMSNSRDCNMLFEIKDKFDKLTCKFLKDEAQKGLAYLYAEPHQPFVLPCQIHLFNKELIIKNSKKNLKKTVNKN